MKVYRAVITYNGGGCGAVRHVATFTVKARCEKEAPCAVGQEILKRGTAHRPYHQFAANLLDGISYWYDYSLYLTELGPARPGVYIN